MKSPNVLPKEFRGNNIHRTQSFQQHLAIDICTTFGHLQFTCIEVWQQQSCTEHRHVHITCRFTCFEVWHQESAPTTVVSMTLPIPVHRGLLERICKPTVIWYLAVYLHRCITTIICTHLNHVHNIWWLTWIDIRQKDSAQTTVMSTMYLHRRVVWICK